MGRRPKPKDIRAAEAKVAKHTRHRLKDWRERDRRSLTDVSEITGIPMMTLSDYERGKNVCPVECLRTLAMLYRAPLSDIKMTGDPLDTDARQIADLITRPPGVEFFKGKVTSFNPDDPIALAVRAMYTKSYSQAPIYENGHFAGLLTTNTIARWLGAQASEDIFSLQETPIRDVLRFSENDDNHRFLPRKATLFDVMELFHAHERRGGRLDAVLITENGAPSEKPLGIITAWDLPKVMEAIHVGPREP